MRDIGEPDCPLGYTQAQIEQAFETEDELAHFYKWMNGQTQGICEGRAYNHDLKKYEADECDGTPHGPVVYSWDMDRYIHMVSKYGFHPDVAKRSWWNEV